MKRSLILIPVVALLGGLLVMPGFAQESEQGDGTAPPVRTRQITADLAPVTPAEVKKATERLDSLLRPIVGLKVGSAQLEQSLGEGPASRDEIINRLDLLRLAMEESYVVTPYPLEVDESRLVVQGESRAKLIRLIQEGYVANISPLASGTKPGLSPEEFGDHLAYFGGRVCELAHIPLTDWSPELQNPYKSG